MRASAYELNQLFCTWPNFLAYSSLGQSSGYTQRATYAERGTTAWILLACTVVSDLSDIISNVT